MFVVVIISTGDGTDGYGLRFHSIRFNSLRAAQECRDLTKSYAHSVYIIEDVRQ